MSDVISRSEMAKSTASAAPISQAGSPGLPRSVGAVRVAFLGVGERTVLADLHQSGCMKARLPKVYGDEPKSAVLINTAGGLTGGDRVSTLADWGQGADACFSTQAAERIYKSSGGDAAVRNHLTVSAGARAEWLPQEMILFDGGRLSRTTEVDLADDARFLAIESMVLGRKAMGETIRSGLIDDTWRIRRNGQLIYRDSFRLDGAFREHRFHPTRLGGCEAYATIIIQVEEPTVALETVRHSVGTSGGASSLKGLVVGRLVAPDGDALREILAVLIPKLRQVVMGRAERLPRVFQI